MNAEQQCSNCLKILSKNQVHCLVRTAANMEDGDIYCKKCYAFVYDLRKYREHVLNLEWFYFKRKYKYRL